MNVLIIDAQGGGIGKQLISEIKNAFPNFRIMAVGTNSAATMAMLKAGADEAATGENPVVVASKKADVIIGPIGIVIADSMLGEITPRMALSVAQSSAKRILIPFNQCNNTVVGVANANINTLVHSAVDELKKHTGC